MQCTTFTIFIYLSYFIYFYYIYFFQSKISAPLPHPKNIARPDKKSVLNQEKNSHFPEATLS